MTTYFSNPPHGPFGVFSTVFSIAKEHWKPLGLIAIFQILSGFGAFLVLALITSIVDASYFAVIQNVIGAVIAVIIIVINALGPIGAVIIFVYNALQGPIKSYYGNDYYGNDYYGRSLVEHSIGFHGASRLLGGGYYDLIAEDLTPGFIAGLFFIIVLWVTVLSLITGIYLGTFYHAMANIYTGNIPSVRESMNHGVTRMWSVYCFQILYRLAIGVLCFLLVGLPLIHDSGIILGSVLLMIVMVYFSSLMSAATPSIILEKRGAIGAFRRSIELCKSFICFIFCTQLLYFVMKIVVSILINLVLGYLPEVLASFGHVFVSIVFNVVSIVSNVVSFVLNVGGQVLCFVIYMTVRIRKENTTKEEVAMEIGTNHTLSSGVEMQDNQKYIPFDSV